MDNPTSDRERFDALEECIEGIIDHCREAGIIVCDYQSSISYQKKINDLVKKLQEVEAASSSIKDIHVPKEVFYKIDAGQNPQLFTKECLERALMRNEAARGKIDIMKKFRAELISELFKEFPNEIAKYRTRRGDPERVPKSSSQPFLNGSSVSPDQPDNTMMR
ncbi:Mediator of RNA polymerase II transcription subunit 10 [Cichlidogyrus casuarinus]|uniref:Mediator of RNA polymerase II transcription subunit 10 n=1 Tax=Cichlidogyrus casuarinus TaxID=1844966 RepID=A0ABD2Q2D9_9PLAT